ADRLGTYGYHEHETSPFIDQVAAHGVVFENASAPAPWTIPSVASLFTSTYPCEHNMLSKFNSLSASANTLAERMKRLGYSTYSLFGNSFIGPQFGMSQGFDHLRQKGRNGGPEVNELLGPNPSLPLLIYIHNMEPHDPYHYAPPHTPGFRDVSPEARGRMKAAFHGYKSAAEFDYGAQLPLGTNDKSAEQDENLAKLRAMRDDWSELYDACVRLADSRVGSLAKLLHDREFWDNTLFIVVADHGEEMNDHGAWLHDQSVYEELMHVPLIVRFPNDQFAGRRISEPVSLVDILPTILDYIDREHEATGARGRSLMPLIRGETDQRGEPLFVPGLRINTTRYYRPWVETRGDVNVVIRQKQWKGIWNADIDTFELYDLSADPFEKYDVRTAHADLVAAMRTHAQSWYEGCRTQTQETGTVDYSKLDEATLRNLRALGYIGGDETDEDSEDADGDE
ncbi:MAG: sulfatase, partial [Phycisphaerae bacterium]|nr:sulfatase [Phycisphaerae bacterium]